MLAAVVIKLRPLAEARLPASHGALAHSAALELFLRCDPSLAAALHAGDTPRPFTVSPIVGPVARQGGELLLDPTAVYSWRLTGLEAATSNALLDTRAGAGIRLGAAVFAVVDVRTRSDEDSEAGSDGYGALLSRWAQAEPPAAVGLEFRTPTTFRVGRLEQPVPLPRWVFGSLARTWDAFGPARLGLNAGDLDERVALANWRGETRRVELGQYRTVGFVGRCLYRVVDPSPELRRLIGLLAEYGFYAGVGWLTTHGLGQARPRILARSGGRDAVFGG